MQSLPTLETPRPVPDAARRLCQDLEARGIALWSHGEGLLADLRPLEPETEREAETGSATALRGRPSPARAFLCQTDADSLLSQLPTAIVTASGGRRLTLPDPTGPIDLIPIGERPLEEVLVDFGLGPLGLAWREQESRFCDPVQARADLARGRMGPTRVDPSPFALAPRRFWIGARLLSEQRLEPEAALLEAARAAIQPTAESLPLGAPARRELARVLAAEEPAPGLDFLYDAGLTPRLLPGVTREAGSRLGGLPRLPVLRWAAWLRGCALQRAFVELRMPHALGRAITRLQRAHPIDQTVSGSREIGLRKLLQRHPPEEIDALMAWRRWELESDPATTAADLERLDSIRGRIEAAREDRARDLRRRTLALDGQAVMELLDAGPGPHVGRALAHLARHVETHPDANERGALAQELRRWARSAPSTGEIG